MNESLAEIHSTIAETRGVFLGIVFIGATCTYLLTYHGRSQGGGGSSES